MKDLLKRDKWWFWGLILLFGQGTVYTLILALSLDNIIEKDAWYTKWEYWVLGMICCFFPAMIMFLVFQIQLLINCAKKLELPGDDLYATPYVWLLCLIVPIIGWILLIVMMLYLEIFTIVAISNGKAEKFIENQ
ncbi:MAG: hypothetical protein KH135_04580 [Firmicutes bacterium]|nr:hypothetical protein [Bacillota bacterium]